MKNNDVSDFIKNQINAVSTGSSRTITFYSPVFHKGTGEASATISVTIGDGDVIGILEAVQETGGIWNEEATIFVPYPCACVEIKDA